MVFKNKILILVQVKILADKPGGFHFLVFSEALGILVFYNWADRGTAISAYEAIEPLKCLFVQCMYNLVKFRRFLFFNFRKKAENSYLRLAVISLSWEGL